MDKTILSVLLKELHVKSTCSFTNNYFMEHPYKYTMYGLSRMLFDYKIPNMGIKLDNKSDDILDVDIPFVAHIGNDFVVVNSLSENKIRYIWNNHVIDSGLEEFKQLWSGAILLPEPDEHSIEPDYKKHRLDSLFKKSRNIALLLLAFIAFFMVIVDNTGLYSFGSYLHIFINLAGLYISYLLILKQLNIKSHYADKICSLTKQGDCNDVLTSDAAKLFGIFSWSEIGLGYFASNLIVILLFPNLLSFYVLLNICSLPYTFWSIWYQHKKAKSWCMLCVIVQVLLWGIFFVNLIFFDFIFLVITFHNLLLLATIYLLPFLLTSFIVSNVYKANKLSAVTQELNSLKMNDDVFLAQLKKRSFYPIDTSLSQIKFGNPEASLNITILTNPHCEPCAYMHRRVERVLDTHGDKLSVQYIFSAFAEYLLQSNKFLIAVYLHKDAQTVKEIYSEWFEKGKYTKEDYFNKFQLDLESEKVVAEQGNHEKWKTNNKLMATPTILVNGYQLPDNYKIEDLVYFTDLAIN